jgi:hypothetical protein
MGSRWQSWAGVVGVVGGFRLGLSASRRGVVV